MKYKLGDAPAIIAYGRTPFTLLNGRLSQISPIDFSAQCIRQLIYRSGISASDVTDLVVGNVLQAGAGQLPAKQIAMKVGLPTSISCSSVNMVCSSGLEAIMTGARIVSLEPDRVVIAGGYESMSQTPYASLPESRGSTLPRLGSGSSTASPADLPLVDLLHRDGLSDALSGLPMGNIAEMCAHMDSIGRELQDTYCITSYRRAIAAQSGGLMREITPVVIRNAPVDEETDGIQSEEHNSSSCDGRHKRPAAPSPAISRKVSNFKRFVGGSIGVFAHSPRAAAKATHDDIVEIDEAPGKLDEAKVVSLRGCFGGWAKDTGLYGITAEDYGCTVRGDREYAEYVLRKREREGGEEGTEQLAEEMAHAHARAPTAAPTLSNVPADAASTHTAANSSKITDGAAFVIVVSQEYLRTHGAEILAASEFHEPPVFIDGFVSVGTHPSLFPVAPSLAISRLLDETAVSLGDVSHVEINEAFSSIAVNNALRIGLSIDEILDPASKRFNASGGGVSIGHPLGASGARLVVTLCRQLNESSTDPDDHLRQHKRAIAAICNGGGGACAMLLRM